MTYSVRAFLGAPNVNPKLWATDKNYVGQVATLSSPRMNSNVTVTANIVLTDKLVQKFKVGELRSLEKGAVNEYLKENFYWRIQQVDSTEIMRFNASTGLKVTVISIPVRLPRSEVEVPQWIGTFSYHPEILGQPAGGNTTDIGSNGTNSMAPTLASPLNEAAQATGPVAVSIIVENETTKIVTVTQVVTVTATASVEPESSTDSMSQSLSGIWVASTALTSLALETPAATGVADVSTVVEDGVTRVVITRATTVVETVFAIATAAA